MPDDFTPVDDFVADDFQPKKAEPKSVGGFLSNIASSGAKFASSLGHAAMHPIDTASAMADVGMGAIETGAQKVGQAFGLPSPDAIVAQLEAKQKAGAKLTDDERNWLQSVKAFQGTVSNYRDRYGSLPAIGKTLYEDPVGAAADVSMLAGGVSSAARGGARLAAKMPRLQAALETTAKGAQTVADVTNPVQATSKVAKAVSKRPRQYVANKLMSHALNVPIDASGRGEQILESVEKAKRIRDTALTHGYVPGSEKSIVQSVGDIDNQLAMKRAAIEQANKLGADVDPQAIMQAPFQHPPSATGSPWEQTIAQRYTNSMLPEPATIEKVTTTYAAPYKPVQPQPSGLLGPTGSPIPAPPPGPWRKPGVVEAQQNLSNTYGQLSDDVWGKLTTAEKDAVKAMASKENEQIIAATKAATGTDITPFNAEMSRIIEAQPYLGTAMSKTMNSPLGDFGPGLWAARGMSYATGSPVLGAAGGVARQLGRMPGMAGRTALAIAPNAPQMLGGYASKLEAARRAMPWLAQLPPMVPPGE